MGKTDSKRNAPGPLRPGLLSLACLIAILVSFVRPSPIRASPAVVLDETAVFCLYHWLSGEAMDDRDLEALSRRLGRPTYTDYKPSEMFTRRSLSRLKAALGDAMARFDTETLFVQDLTLTGKKRDAPPLLLPAPTPYIEASLTERGNHRLCRMLAEAGGHPPVRVAIYYKPEKIRQAIQSRNIALQAVDLPIRSVILKPVRVEVIESPGTEKGWTRHQHPAARQK